MFTVYKLSNTIAEEDKTFENEVDQTKEWQEVYEEIEPVKEQGVHTPVEKKDLESSEESQRLTEEELDELDQDEDWNEAKRQWKDDNPDDTIKAFKELYLQGKIDDLPWEDYLQDPESKKKKKYIMKQGPTQIRKSIQE